MSDLSDLAAQVREARKRLRAALQGEHHHLIEQLAERRIKLGLTQEQVATLVGISRGQIANAETGKGLLSVESLIGYAEAVGSRLVVEDKETPKG